MNKEIRFPVRSPFQTLSLIVLLLFLASSTLSLYAQDEEQGLVQ